MIKPTAILFLMLGVCACDSNKETGINEELSKQLVGTWQSQSVNFDMPSYSNGAGQKTFRVDSGEWEKKMGARAVKSTYFINGSFENRHYNLSDSLILKPAGWWMIVGDTISLRDTFPQKGPVYKYHIRLSGKHLVFTGREDCDSDGSVDDLYTGVSVKVE